MATTQELMTNLNNEKKKILMFAGISGLFFLLTFVVLGINKYVSIVLVIVAAYFAIRFLNAFKQTQILRYGIATQEKNPNQPKVEENPQVAPGVQAPPEPHQTKKWE